MEEPISKTREFTSEITNVLIEKNITDPSLQKNSETFPDLGETFTRNSLQFWKLFFYI